MILWPDMNQRPRKIIADLLREDIPKSAGVYALYKDDESIYVGKAAVLRDRIWKNHCGRGRVMNGSALRRNIAEHLQIASSADIKTRRYQPSAQEVARVRNWLDGCEIAWIQCDSERTAAQLEADFKAEYVPLLTKR